MAKMCSVGGEVYGGFWSGRGFSLLSLDPILSWLQVLIVIAVMSNKIQISRLMDIVRETV